MIWLWAIVPSIVKAVLFALPLFFLFSVSFADEWPRWFGPGDDGVWRETGILEKFPASGPNVIWRQPIGSGYSGPAVAAGRVYVMDRQTPDRGLTGTDRVVCLDAKTGAQIWEHSYPSSYEAAYRAGPRATPNVDGDHVFTLGTEGEFFCLNSGTGEVIWTRHYKNEFGAKTPTWGFAAAPLIEDDLVIGIANQVVAFDKSTGELRWKALESNEPGYCAPRIINYRGNRQLLIWRPDGVHALEPKTGQVIWSIPWQLRAGLSIPMPRLSTDRSKLFLTSFYNGSLMLGLEPNGSTPKILWRTEEPSEKRTTHLNSIMSTPVLRDGHIYGVCSYGQFRCLRIDTGERVWEDQTIATGGNLARWGNVFITPHEPSGRFFLFNELGDLIVGNLTPTGFEESTRAHLLEPNGVDLRQRPIVWTQPAFADRKCFARNDTEIICVDLADH